MKKASPFLKGALWFSGIVAAIFILAICLFIFGPSIKSYIQEVPFNSDQWKANLETHDNLKQNMVSDLLSRYTLQGMSRDEIENLLGKPPKTDYFKDYDYVYWLGPEKGMGVDSEWLGIQFNNGVVITADILRD
jgi:hypothetical protein